MTRIIAKEPFDPKLPILANFFIEDCVGVLPFPPKNRPQRGTFRNEPHVRDLLIQSLRAYDEKYVRKTRG